MGDGVAAMAFVLMALHELPVGRKEGGGEGRRGRGALTTLYAKSAASSSSASSIDRRDVARFLPSCARLVCVRPDRRVIREKERFCEMDARPVPRRHRPRVASVLPSMTRPDFIQQ